MTETVKTKRVVEHTPQKKIRPETSLRWRLKHRILALRPEEFISLLFFLPMAYFTFKAYLFFRETGDVPNVFAGAVQRFFVVLFAVFVVWLIARYKPNWRVFRDALPFGFCIAIYTNLHDTVHFVNPHDIHEVLILLDGWLFGAQPCVWTQKFIHPTLTEIFSFCYMIFFIFAPFVAAVLYLQKRYREFRHTMFSVIFCFYLGYILYIVFPAVPPRITLKPLFYIDFHGALITDAALKTVSILPADSRCAFPSLHSAVTLLSLMFACRYSKVAFWVMLPFCLGLLLSTVYLRHHYVVDLLAGFILAICSFNIGPRVEDWWRQKRIKYNLSPVV
jgi:membrane-associated phospholipid phosphatase